MLPYKDILVNGTHNVFLCQSFQLRLDQFGVSLLHNGNNLFTKQHWALAKCLPTTYK